jgi:hypothetical protein
MTSTYNIYQPGDEVAIAFAITDSTGAAYDPATVRFHYTDPLGVDYLKTYLIDTAFVTKVSTGNYKLVIFIPYNNASKGMWYYDAQALDGSTNSLLVQAGSFYVEAIGTL